MCHGVVGYAGHCWGYRALPGGTEVFLVVQWCADVLDYTRVCRCVPECGRVCHCVVARPVCRDVPGLARVSGVRGVVGYDWSCRLGSVALAGFR